MNLRAEHIHESLEKKESNRYMPSVKCLLDNYAGIFAIKSPGNSKARIFVFFINPLIEREKDPTFITKT